MDFLREHINDLQSVICKEAVERGRRKIERVLVVDLIIRRSLQNIAKLGVLKHSDAVLPEKSPKPFGN